MPLVRPQTGLILPPTNRLAYPAGRAPGVDPNHVVGAQVLFSSVAVPGNHINLMRGNFGVVVGTVTPRFTDAGWGTSIVANTAAGLRFDNIEPAVDKHVAIDIVTMAAIFRVNGTGDGFVSCVFCMDNGNAQGFGIGLNNAAVGLSSAGVTIVTVFSGLTVGATYFAALSTMGDTAAISPAVLVNLDTGQTKTAVYQALNLKAAATPSGNYCVGNLGTTQALAADATTFATMASPRGMSLAQLQAWSADPWAFWYPRQTQMLVSTQAATQYAAFSIPQRGGRTITQMRGY